MLYVCLVHFDQSRMSDHEPLQKSTEAKAYLLGAEAQVQLMKPVRVTAIFVQGVAFKLCEFAHDVGGGRVIWCMWTALISNCL